MNNKITHQKIHQLCEQYNIENYVINDDMSIDVDGDVDLSDKNLSRIPIKFGKVVGYFACAGNKLTTLEGCPSYVNGDFSCSFNDLTSLENCPNYVGGAFSCSWNKLTSLEYCPNYVGGDFSCSWNKLTSLEYCPNYVGGAFWGTIFHKRQPLYNINVGGKIHSNNVWKF